MTSQYSFIVTISLLLGTACGWIMHRSDFCFAGAFRDLYLFRSRFLLRQLLLLVTAGMLLFEGGRLTGIFSVPFPLFGPASGTHFLGGVLFGIGMVLAGGCVVGSLYKAGAGSLPSAVAVVGIVLGSAIYAEIHPAWVSLSQALQLATGMAVTLPQLTGIDPTWLVLAWIAASVLLFLRWQKQGLWIRLSHADGHLKPWKAALALAVIGALSVAAVGMPVGVTTGYSKIAAWAEYLAAPRHLARLDFFNTVSLDYLHPLYAAPLQGGAGAQFDAISAIQWSLMAGLVLGAAVSAARIKELHLRWQAPAAQYLSAIGGGVLMGVAARFGSGCNVWHLWGGLAILALPSILFVAGLFPGAWLGSRILTRWVL